MSRWPPGAFVFSFILILGCASTKMTSQVNPDATGRSFTRLLVHGNFQNLEYRQLAEGKLCAELGNIGTVECFKSYELFFPGEEHSVEHIAARLTELRIDGILVLQPTGSGTTSSYIPQTSFTTGSATANGNTVSGSSTTYTSGGFNVNMPWANYEAVLWSANDGKVVWYATAASSAGRWSASTGPDDLINSASSEAVSKLVSDGVFEESKR